MHRTGPGVLPSPNLWQHPGTYELLNRAADPDGLVDAALAEVAPWAGRDVVDVGCGTGFHLPAYLTGAGAARSVVGVEPHPPLVELARRRCAGLPVTVLPGEAAALPLPDRSVDAVHARWAYFFGPGCEPGLAEVFRVVRPGGAFAVVDLDPHGEGYGTWLRRAFPAYDPEAVERFWRRLGFERGALAVRWRFERRDDLAAVLAIEFPPSVARRALAATPGRELPVPTVVRWRAAGELTLGRPVIPPG